ncbi:MAG TPA: 30S ribosomal protein S15 [Candidatus Nanoarchaeia archaeon]|nr:30S ribosomal protein S15 [Candidatus Nanoarchaeia archaeon]
MARMYSGKRGKAGSKKPDTNIAKPWITYTSEEVEQLVVKLSKQGKGSAVIGLVLRDQYGIPDIKAVAKKKISKILKDHKLSHEIPEQLMFLIKKEIKLTKHLVKNKKDMPTRRGLLLTNSKIRNLVRYYQRTKVLPVGWAYDKEQIKVA